MVPLGILDFKGPINVLGLEFMTFFMSSPEPYPLTGRAQTKGFLFHSFELT